MTFHCSKLVVMLLVPYMGGITPSAVGQRSMCSGAPLVTKDLNIGKDMVYKKSDPNI